MTSSPTAGLGVALLADWLVREDIACGRLVPLLERYAAPPAPVFALRPSGRFSPVSVRALTEYLATALSSRLK